MIKLDRTGIILYTIHYNECVAFYENTLEMTRIFETDSLTCFEFGESYLMVEKDDEQAAKDSPSRIRTCLRMNVTNVRDLADRLIEKNVKVEYQENTWGTVAKFYDPDGNLCAFKDSRRFEKQITEFKNK